MIINHSTSTRGLREFMMIVVIAAALFMGFSCSTLGGMGGRKPLPDSLVVGTLYTPTGFFILHDDTLGYDYDQFCDFARAKGIKLKWKVAPNMGVLIDWLEKDSVQVLACEIPATSEYKKRVHNCGAVNETYQVLIQPQADSLITDVTQLVGKDVYVEKGSKYESRMKNLDNELGGGIIIHAINPDSASTEDLVDMVIAHKIPLTVVDSDIAQLCHTYSDSINISLRVSFGQQSSWAVSLDNKWLGDSIDAWTLSGKSKAYSKSALKRYFELSRHITPLSRDTDSTVVVPPGCISLYDELFKKYGRKGHIDWRLLAAIGYVESHFNPTAESWAGARGIMQLMPSTAQGHGLALENICDPEENIRVAVECILKLDKLYQPKVENMSERVKFILASYNAGAGHILDAIELAKKNELDPQVWDGNVEEALNLKSLPEYYNDPVCRFGYFRSNETVNYVAAVVQRYFFYKNKYPGNHNEAPTPRAKKDQNKKNAGKHGEVPAGKDKVKGADPNAPDGESASPEPEKKSHHHHHSHHRYYYKKNYRK